MKNKKPVLIIVILRKNVFSATRLTKKTSKTAHAAKIAKVSKLIHNSFFIILFQLDAHAKSSTVLFWTISLILAKILVTMKIINAVLKYKKTN